MHQGQNEGQTGQVQGASGERALSGVLVFILRATGSYGRVPDVSHYSTVTQS